MVGIVKLNDVAKAAGVSPATAAKVLCNSRGNTRVSKETAERITQVAKKMNFQPNAAARSLATGKSRTVGVFYPNQASPGMLTVLESLSDRLREFDYSTYFILGPEDEETAERITRRLHRQIDGIVMLHRIGDFGERNHPFALLKGSYSFEDYEIAIDSISGCADAVRHLIQVHEHNMIGYISAHHKRFNLTRTTGINMALNEAGLPPEKHLVEISGIANPDFAKDIHHAIFQRKCRAYICHNDYIAGKFMHFLARHSVRVPEEVAVIGLDGLTFAEFTSPVLTTIEQPFPLYGRRCAELIIKKIEEKIFENLEQEKIPVTLHIGRSCGCPQPPEYDDLYWTRTTHILGMMRAGREECPLVPVDTVMSWKDEFE